MSSNLNEHKFTKKIYMNKFIKFDEIDKIKQNIVIDVIEKVDNFIKLIDEDQIKENIF
jgi:hypothetical protein